MPNPLYIIHVYKNISQALALEAKLDAYDGVVTKIDDEAEHIKPPEFGGRWTERWLDVFLESGADVAIKIDPDTEPPTNFDFPPTDVFGRMAGDVIHGDLMGITQWAAQRIVNSGYLLDEKYKEYIYSSRGVVTSSQDSILTDVMRRLNLSFGVWHG